MIKILIALSLTSLKAHATDTTTVTLSAPVKAVESVSSGIKVHSFRLVPGQDFMVELNRWAKEHHIKAASIISVVGSFKKINLRYANEPNTTSQDGFFEIVSIVGTFNESSGHLHASLSNSKGVTFGGHLVPGNIVYTTAEVVVAELPGVIFTREHDEASGYEELVVKRKK